MRRAVERAFRFLTEERRRSRCAWRKAWPNHIAAACGGDVRKAMNAVELCCPCGRAGTRAGGLVTLETRKRADPAQRACDTTGKGTSITTSSLRFKNPCAVRIPDAAIHYLARLLEAGDLPSACRRLLVCASEDVGLAYPQIIPIVKAAVDTALHGGPAGSAVFRWRTRCFSYAMRQSPTAAYNAILAAMAGCARGKSGANPTAITKQAF